MEKEIIKIGTNLVITLTKPKKVGRPSKKDKLIYGVSHSLNIPEDSPLDLNTRLKLFQIEADKINLPIKFI